MITTQELYTSAIRPLPEAERLLLARLILDDLSVKSVSAPERRHAIEILDELPGQSLFQTSAEADAYLEEERNSWDR